MDVGSGIYGDGEARVSWDDGAAENFSLREKCEHRKNSSKGEDWEKT